LTISLVQGSLDIYKIVHLFNSAQKTVADAARLFNVHSITVSRLLEHDNLRFNARKIPVAKDGMISLIGFFLSI